ncbi:hypothetical protein N0S71_27950, partial [Klebsiella pneumoniae]|uniref:hypothetical protein n=1 Tax=Klebsiella pneumoniae TaxID=573 RepID=UPI00217FF5D4
AGVSPPDVIRASAQRLRVRNNLGKIDIKTLSFQNRIIYMLVKFNLPKFIWLAFTFHRLMKL